MIRTARDEDFDAIAEITNHWIRTTCIHFAIAETTAEELRAGRGDFPWLVAEREGRVVGYAKAGTWRARDAYRHTAETGIYLAPDAVGGGLGRELYAALLRACDEAGLHTLVAGIALPNEPSVRLHERLGFRYVGTFREVGRKHDRWHDVGFWQRGP